MCAYQLSFFFIRGDRALFICSRVHINTPTYRRRRARGFNPLPPFFQGRAIRRREKKREEPMQGRGTEKTGVYPRRGGQIISVAPRILLNDPKAPSLYRKSSGMRDPTPGTTTDPVQHVFADELVLGTDEIRAGLDAYAVDMAIGTASLNGLGRLEPLTKEETAWLGNNPQSTRRYRIAKSARKLEDQLRFIGVSNTDYVPTSGNTVIGVQRGGVHNIINNGTKSVKLFQPVYWKLPPMDIDPSNPETAKLVPLEDRKFEHANRDVNKEGRRVPIIEPMTIGQSAVNTCRELFELPIGNPGNRLVSDDDWNTKYTVDELKRTLAALMSIVVLDQMIGRPDTDEEIMRFFDSFRDLDKGADNLSRLSEMQETVYKKFDSLRKADKIASELTAPVVKYTKTDLVACLINLVTEVAFANRRNYVGIARSAATPGMTLEVELRTA